jgi:ABC-type phosphate/phosphonate transport system substrate-binding protein
MTWHSQPPFAVLAGLVAAAVLVPEGVATDTPRRADPLRLAFTSAVMAGVSRSEAEASISVWTKTLATVRGYLLDASTVIHDDLPALGREMAQGRVQLVALTTEQYWQLGAPDFGTTFVGQRGGRVGQEVLLIVRRDAGLTSLGALRGRSLVALDMAGEGMARTWLESLLLEQGLEPAAQFFSSVVSVNKPARAALPVFFGQHDACLLTRGAFDTIVELNPQVGQVLVPLLYSVPLQHSLLLLDVRYDPAARPAVVDALLNLHDTPRGQQVLSLFGRERLVLGTAADLASSLDLLGRRDRLRERSPGR